MAGCSWDSLGTKLSCDGTPLDDEDAGNLKSPTFLIFVTFLIGYFASQVFTMPVTGQPPGPTLAKRKNCKYGNANPGHLPRLRLTIPFKVNIFNVNSFITFFKNSAFEFLVQNRTIRPRLPRRILGASTRPSHIEWFIANRASRCFDAWPLALLVSQSQILIFHLFIDTFEQYLVVLF